MRNQIASPARHFIRSVGPAVVLAAATVIFVPAAHAQASNSSNSQVASMPSWTVRPPDLHLALNDDPQGGAGTQEAVEHRNEKRRELVVWASNELVTLSQRVQEDVTRPGVDANSSSSAATNAEKIEQLAKNLIAALKAP